MPTLPQIPLAIVVDIVSRVSLVLAAGLVLTPLAGRNAASRYSLLVASLGAVLFMPATMLAAHAFPQQRWQIDWLGAGNTGGRAEPSAALPEAKRGRALTSACPWVGSADDSPLVRQRMT